MCQEALIEVSLSKKTKKKKERKKRKKRVRRQYVRIVEGTTENIISQVPV